MTCVVVQKEGQNHERGNALHGSGTSQGRSCATSANFTITTGKPYYIDEVLHLPALAGDGRWVMIEATNALWFSDMQP